MVIPIGKDYTFTLQVLQPNSLEPLNVTGYTGTLSIFRQDDYTELPVQDAAILPVSGNQVDGIMQCTIPGTTTAAMSVSEDDKGDTADHSYVKARYAGFIHITKAGAAGVNVSIPAISFVFAG